VSVEGSIRRPAVSAGQSYRDVLGALSAAVQQPNASLALLLVNLVGVSKLQARLGFDTCALLLQALSDGLIEALRGRGLVIGLGDGSFCVIVNAIRNSGHAVLAGEKLARAADDAMTAAMVAVKPQLNIGISLFPSQAADPEKLLRLAQLAAAAAHHRTARVLLFDESCASDVLTPWKLGDAFAQALDAGELSVYYQPQVCMTSGRPVGVEALMRWLKNGKPVATPDVFIPLAEEAGLIYHATWYALSNSFRMAGECGELSVAVNITPGMLHHREFIDMVRTAVGTWGVRDKGMTLEITEGGLIADFVQAVQRLKMLREMGLRVSIDDFGTGYSSLSYFKKIPANELKVDKSFVMRMMEDPADQRLVETILGLARQFNLETVAEGVEDRATFDALANMGCTYAQGYLFAPALSAERLHEWLQRNSRDLRVRAAE
jgi:predicted signal transduction protein with EAL and GGDEF domain